MVGCGVDGETISRFSSHVAQPAPLPMVFSPQEVEHIKKLADPEIGFCAAFCCKEAVFKALGKPIDFVECELFYNPEQSIHRPILSFQRDTISEISDCTVRFFHDRSDELVAVVHLFGST